MIFTSEQCVLDNCLVIYPYGYILPAEGGAKFSKCTKPQRTRRTLSICQSISANTAHSAVKMIFGHGAPCPYYPISALDVPPQSAYNCIANDEF